jgi:hypothetical protein
LCFIPYECLVTSGHVLSHLTYCDSLLSVIAGPVATVSGTPK